LNLVIMKTAQLNIRILCLKKSEKLK
jgi:hypothetical protein